MAIHLANTPNEMIDLITRRSITASPFTDWLGVDLVAAWGGTAELRFTPRPEALQHRGTIHGGVLTGLIDNLGGWAATTEIGPVVTTSVTAHFHRPATTAVRGAASVQHHTRRTAVVIATIHDVNEFLIATGLVTAVALDDRTVLP